MVASISDVAKLAGVSKSTVSLVCNNKGYVSPETREKIERAMAELNYTPSALGQNLKLSPRASHRPADRTIQAGGGWRCSCRFHGIDRRGDTVSLYGVQAKLKLVDFWASWCAPCRAELPNVKRIYKKYRELGLEIIGVSIDQKPADWMKALEEEKLPWPNIIDPEGKIANHYFVRAIPYTLLLDENNKIIAKNLRGKELEKKIAELLAK